MSNDIHDFCNKIVSDFINKLSFTTLKQNPTALYQNLVYSLKATNFYESVYIYTLENQFEKIACSDHDTEILNIAKSIHVSIVNNNFIDQCPINLTLDDNVFIIDYIKIFSRPTTMILCLNNLGKFQEIASSTLSLLTSYLSKYCELLEFNTASTKDIPKNKSLIEPELFRQILHLHLSNAVRNNHIGALVKYSFTGISKIDIDQIIKTVSKMKRQSESFTNQTDNSFSFILPELKNKEEIHHFNNRIHDLIKDLISNKKIDHVTFIADHILFPSNTNNFSTYINFVYS